MKALVLTSSTAHRPDFITWLEEMDGTVTPVASLRQASAALETDPGIDIVVAAIDPAGEGVSELVRALKGDPRLSSIPVIIAGTDFDTETVSHLLSLGVDDIISLPGSKASFHAKVHAALEHGKSTVLVIDDEPAILGLLESFLELERYIPVTAGSAEEGLEIIESQRVDVVISDIMLPGMTGVELLSAVKEKYSHIPVILITGFSGRFTPKDAIAMGADGYFAKPFHNIELIYTLRRVLKRYQRVRNRPLVKSGEAVI